MSELRDTVPEKWNWCSFWICLGEAESGDPLGEYRVEVEVEDRIGGETATASITFILE